MKSGSTLRCTQMGFRRLTLRLSFCPPSIFAGKHGPGNVSFRDRSISSTKKRLKFGLSWLMVPSSFNISNSRPTLSDALNLPEVPSPSPSYLSLYIHILTYKPCLFFLLYLDPHLSTCSWGALPLSSMSL